MKYSWMNGRPWVRKPDADDQHALVAQRREPPTDLEQVLRVEVGHRQLEDRDVGVGVHRLQRHPGAVVEAAARPVEDRLVVGHQGPDLAASSGAPGAS